MQNPGNHLERPSSERGFTRRGFLGTMGAAAIGAGLGSAPIALAQPASRPAGGQRFRFVFMPDIHLMKDRRGPQGMAAALEAVNRLQPKPTFIVTGGDLIDSLRDMDLDQATELADLFVRIWSDHTNLPAYHVFGNHDAAGWRSKAFPRDHSLFAFNMLRTRLHMPGLNHSFDHGGWHFVALHNITLREPDSYISEYDASLLAFLRRDLGQHGSKPTILFGHFPPVSAIEFFAGRAEHEDGAWTLSSQRVSRNPMDLVEAIRGANVKAIVSGHIHRLDRIEAMGQTFICAGSVSGDKWRGHDHETPADFGVVDCSPDGQFEYYYHDYGWDAQAGRSALRRHESEAAVAAR